jgi:hypothetical protein
MTLIQSIVGPENMAFMERVPARDGSRGRPITAIYDGTSNTLMVVEAAEAVPWTKPADVEFDGDAVPKLGDRFGGRYGDGFIGALADGSVWFFPAKKLDPATLKALITPRGGEVIDLEFLYGR